MSATLTPTDIARWRMHTQGLVGPGYASPVVLAAQLGAVQFQDHALALWSVAQRVPGATVADVQFHLDGGDLLRTHVLRPTWHVVTADDVRWMLALTAPRVHVQNGSYYRRHGLDDDVLARAHEVLRATLADDRHRTRGELAEALADRGIPVGTPNALAYVVMHAELEGVICSGRMRGRRQTYALLDHRAPRAEALTHDAALADLTRRYFTGHGPATLRDLRWWSSLTMAQIERGLELTGDDLHRETVDGRTYLAAGPPPTTLRSGDAPVVRLLTPLDEYVVGYSDSRGVIDLSGADAALRDTPGLPTALVVIDGQITGRWRRTVRASHVDIDVVSHRPLDGAETAALHAEAGRHAAALGREARLADVRGHAGTRR